MPMIGDGDHLVSHLPGASPRPSPVERKRGICCLVLRCGGGGGGCRVNDVQMHFGHGNSLDGDGTVECMGVKLVRAV